MLTQEERLISGFRALKRLKPYLRSPYNRPVKDRKRDGGDRDTDMGEANLHSVIMRQPVLPDPVLIEKDEFSEDPEESTLYLPSLQTLIDEIGPLSPYSVILGACEDGLPFLLDLTNPAPGSLLISGDPGSGKTRLLTSILASAALFNTPGQVAFCILADDPGEYQGISLAANCYGLLTQNEVSVPDLIDSLISASEQRQKGNLRGPALILAIDNLASLMQLLDEEYQDRLIWLVENGPYSRIWTMAILSSDHLDQTGETIAACFGTRLLGNILSPGLATLLSGDSNSCVAELAAGYQFCVLFGEEWIRFWIYENE